MDRRLVYFSSYELLISLVFGLLTIFIAARFINLFLLRSSPDSLRTNVSTSIFTGGLIICALILVQSSVLPSVDALRTLVLGQEQVTLRIMAISLGYFLAFYTLSIVISILLIYASIRIHMAATLDVDEIREIKADNVAQAVVLTAVLLGMTLFIQEPMGRFISSLVDYDELERMEVEVNPEDTGRPEMPPATSEEMIVVPARKISPDR